MSDYGAVLTFNGELATVRHLDETPRSIMLAPDVSVTRCTECREPLRFVPEIREWVDETGGSRCAGPAATADTHDAERVRFAWLQDATIELQPYGGSGSEWAEVRLTVLQGTVRLRVEQVVDAGHLNGPPGQLLLHVTRPGDDDAPELTPSGGVYLIG